MNEKKKTKRLGALLMRCQKIADRFADDPCKMPHRTTQRYVAMLEECNKLFEAKLAYRKMQEMMEMCK